ncbi:hypothetical protein V9L05_12085 [Bernardetia sp. Wsw4-3y2]|uniref:hypothetical protein n=1 Tax=Bernardetia sp. Wsw4-3y2 TaxID=3127471 RepID=UPI0030CAFC90
MKNHLFIIIVLFIFTACNENKPTQNIPLLYAQESIPSKESKQENDTAKPDNRIVLKYTNLNIDSTYIIDTVSQKQSFLHLLFESTMLPQTNNQLGARGIGLWNGKLNVEECVNTRTEGKNNKLLDISENDTTLNITWQVIDNCCFSFLGDFELVNDSTLNCIYHSYGETHCACNCEYKVTYQLNKYFAIEGYEENYKKLKYISLNGEFLSRFSKRVNK